MIDFERLNTLEFKVNKIIMQVNYIILNLRKRELRHLNKKKN